MSTRFVTLYQLLLKPCLLEDNTKHSIMTGPKRQQKKIGVSALTGEQCRTCYKQEMDAALTWLYRAWSRPSPQAVEQFLGILCCWWGWREEVSGDRDRQYRWATSNSMGVLSEHFTAFPRCPRHILNGAFVRFEKVYHVLGSNLGH